MTNAGKEFAARGDAQAFLTKAMRWKKDECLVWPYGTSHGFPHVKIKRRGYPVRALVCESAYGYAPSKHFKAYVCCKTDRCVAPRHLEWRDSRIEARLMSKAFWSGLSQQERADLMRTRGSEQTSEQRAAIQRPRASEMGRKGGVASGASRRAKAKGKPERNEGYVNPGQDVTRRP